MQGIVVRVASGALHLAYNGVKRTVGMLRRAEVPQARMCLTREPFKERRCQAGFTYSRFARKKHHFAFAAFRPRPASREQFEFLFAAHKVSQITRAQRLEASFDRTCPFHSPHMCEARDAFEVLRAKVLQLKQIAEQFSRAFSNDNLIWRGNAL